MERVYFFGTVIAFLLLLLVGPVAAQEQIFKKEFMTPDRGSETKLSYLLEKLVNSYEAEGQEGANSFASLHDLSTREDLVKIILVIDADPLKELSDSLLFDFRNRIETVGGKIEGRAFNYISAWLPILSLPGAKDWPQIKSVKEPTRPSINDSNNIKKDKLKNVFAQTSIVSEGVSIIGADIWQEKGYTGRGIKVGIIDIGFKGYKELLGKELPSRENVFTKIFGTQTDFLSTEHGTACAEVIHDVAPEADLYLVNITDWEVDFKNAVDWLRSKEINIISCSSGFCNCIVAMSNFSMAFYNSEDELYKQIKSIIDSAVDKGIVWVQAAGNYGNHKWKGSFNDRDGDGFHEFEKEDELYWGNALIGEGEILLLMIWDDTWLKSINDYDLYVYEVNERGKEIICRSEDTQDGDDIPQEICRFSAETDKLYAAAIKKRRGVSKNIKLAFLGDSIFYISNYSKMTITALGCLKKVITVGATPWDDPHNIEPYSSQGPTLEGLIKPDFVAPVCVSTFFYEEFCGTSASVPQVAGACALVLQAFPRYSPSQVRDFLEENAEDLGESDKDIVYGSGLVKLGEPPLTKPDLQAPDYQTKSRYVTEGESFWIKQKIYNAGEGTAGPSHINLYVSADNDWDVSDDYYVGEKTVNSIAPQEYQWVTWDFTFPDLGSGTYEVWVIAEVDCNYEVDESDEDNIFKSNDALTVQTVRCSLADPLSVHWVGFCDQGCQADAPLKVSGGELDVCFNYTRPVNILAGVISDDFEHIWWLGPDCYLDPNYSQACDSGNKFSCEEINMPVERGYLFWLVSPVDLSHLDWENGIYELLFYQVP